ncbi:MAG: DUF3494 domain-containing protein [Chloroflexi bacterium]|nr:DUF3494 domain-containing protein [Chloroflexota bacterium]
MAFVLLFGAAQLRVEASPLRQVAPGLGTAATFAVLGGSTVTNTGPTTINGDLGVSPGTAITGFPPGLLVAGTINAANAAAASAQTDTTTAYNSLAGQACTTTLTPPDITANQELGGRTLVAGVYCFATSAQLTGALTLDAAGDPTRVFIFRIGSTLTTATGSSVLLINGASPCNVFWQVGSSATIGTTTSFQGNILALTSITMNTGASLAGRALARNGAVTMDTNAITRAACGLPLPTATPTTAPAVATSAAAATAVAAAEAAAAAANGSAPPSHPGPATPTLPPATATAVTAATATAIATLPAPTRTAVTAATATAVTAATATAIATLPAATQTAVIAATSTAVTAATATAMATPTISTAGSTDVATPTGGGVRPPVQLPAQLPRTGDGVPTVDGPAVLLFTALLLLAGGVWILRARQTR